MGEELFFVWQKRIQKRVEEGAPKNKVDYSGAEKQGKSLASFLCREDGVGVYTSSIF